MAFQSDEELLLTEKHCCTCKTVKDITNFHKNRSMKDGYSPQCKQCKKADYVKRTEGMYSYRVFDQSELLIDGLKRCSKCETIKVLDNFTKDPSNANHGFSSWCKSCLYAANEKTRREKGQKEKPIIRGELDDKLLKQGLKVCSRCKIAQDIAFFTKTKRGYGGLSAHCRKCRLELDQTKYRERINASTREWRNNNYKWKEQHRLYQAKRKGVIKESKSDISKEFIESIYDTPTCYYCHEYIEREKRTLEHKLPLSRGGLHEESNLTMACLSCNCSKRNKTEEEFLVWKM